MSKREKIERIIGSFILLAFAMIIGIFSGGIFFAAPKKETTPNGKE